VNQLILQYSYLQLLDLMTTIAFLIHGVQEANPMVRLAIQYSHNPFMGLLLVKLIAVGLGLFCWKLDKERLLRRMNVLFAVLVAWNLAALIIASAA
jgi:hypothetical protein